MRDIKFRAWDSRDRKWWDKFELHSDTGKVVGVNHAYKNIHVMQYTGLKDKNGVEIYEGDIVKIGSEELFKIEWLDRTTSWVASGVETGKARWFESEKSFAGEYQFLPQDLEVIGNIYENPELLKETT